MEVVRRDGLTSSRKDSWFVGSFTEYIYRTVNVVKK